MEDEDALLSNSPLDEYLQQVSNEAMFPNANTLNAELQGEEKFYPLNDIGDSLSNSFSYMQQYERFERSQSFRNMCRESNEDISLKRNLNLFNKFQRKDSFNTAISPELLEVSFILLNSIYLKEEDKRYLLEIEEEIQKELVFCNSDTRCGISNNFLDKSFLILSILCCFVGAILSILLKYGNYEQVLGISLLIFISFASFYYFVPRRENLPNILLDEIKNFHEISVKFETLIDKIIKHLKEVEIISNGNSFIQRTQLSFMPERKRKCVKLRQAVFDALMEVYLFVRTRERLLLENNLKKKDMFKEEYLAELPFDVFAEIIEETKTEGEPYIQLDQIKGMTSLYREQFSEYIYSAVILLHCIRKEPHMVSIIGDLLFGYADAVKCLSKFLSELETIYETSVKLAFRIDEKARKHEPYQKTSQITDLLHSSKLSLHSALQRVDDIIALHESQNVTREESRDTFIALVNQYFMSLQDSKYYIDDLIETVKPKLDRGSTELNQENVPIENNDLNTNVTFAQPSQEVGDLLLEGKSTGPVVKQESKEDFEEIRKFLMENKCSKKLMRELKCILSAKDSPAGLISFPINKPDFGILSDVEDDIPPKKVTNLSADTFKSDNKRTYDAKEYFCDGEISGNEQVHLKSELNIDILKTVLTDRRFGMDDEGDEETFGSSDDSES